MVQYHKNKNLESLEGEIWKPIPDYENFYEVSNLGRVKSLERLVKANGNGFWLKKAKIMSQVKDKRGYLCVPLSVNRKIKFSKVYRLVCLAFLENPKNKRTVNHINGIKEDNRLENLEWATDVEQCAHRRDVLKFKGSMYGKKRPPFSQEWKDKISNSKKGTKIDKGRWVIDTQNGVYYRNIRAAAYSIGMKETALRAQLSGENKNKTNFIYA